MPELEAGYIPPIELSPAHLTRAESIFGGPEIAGTPIRELDPTTMADYCDRLPEEAREQVLHIIGMEVAQQHIPGYVEYLQDPTMPPPEEQDLQILERLRTNRHAVVAFIEALVAKGSSLINTPRFREIVEYIGTEVDHLFPQTQQRLTALNI